MHRSRQTGKWVKTKWFAYTMGYDHATGKGKNLSIWGNMGEYGTHNQLRQTPGVFTCGILNVNPIEKESQEVWRGEWMNYGRTVGGAQPCLGGRSLPLWERQGLPLVLVQILTVVQKASTTTSSYKTSLRLLPSREQLSFRAAEGLHQNSCPS